MRYAKRPTSAAVLAFALSIGTFTVQVAPVALLGGLVITQTACPESKSLASIAHRVVKEIDAALPILRSNNVDVTYLLQIREKAEKAEIAFNNSDTATGAQLVGQLLSIFENELLEQINRIPDKTIRTAVLVGLYLVNSRLHDLSDKLEEVAVSTGTLPAVGGSSTAQTIQNFKSKKRWLCRNASTGRYAEMSFCKEFPEQSVVETY